MTRDAIPQPALAELVATWRALVRHHEQTGAAGSVLLRLSIDRAGVGRLEPEAIQGITFRALVEAEPKREGSA